MTIVDLRHLDQIQEHDQAAAGRGFGPWLLGAAGVGALILTAVMSMPEKQMAALSTVDPLSALIAKGKEEPGLPSDQLSEGNASFAQILNDKERPSTALVAVKSRAGRSLESPEARPLPAGPPPGDELPVVPLPAGKLLESTRVTVDPQDGLTELAADRAQLPAGGERAEAGTVGEYQIQVASFREESEANAYVEELRLRGHRAYSQGARVPNRGLWHRVRIGPFSDKFKALAYKADFEQREGMAAFLVDPEKVENREAQRAAKLAARARKQR
jgi:cell division septation protein DedD